jgi:hypothetical protein
MAHGGSVCLRRLAAGERALEVQFHRLLANPKVTVAKLIAGWSQETAPAAAGRHVLGIQDGSEINFQTSNGRNRGLGLIGKGVGRGLLLHPMIAVDAETGECLGLVGGNLWTRPVDAVANRGGKAKQNNARRPLSEKESRYWIETAQAAKTTLSEATVVTMIADREADIYRLWASVPGEKVHVLGRIFRDRPLLGGGTTTTVAQNWPARGTRKITIREREDRLERDAILQMRFGEVTILRPQTAREPDLPKQVTLTLIELTEIDPPEGVEPLLWRLLTTHTVTEGDMAWQIVDWYRRRWTIEQLFRILKKQGLQIEDSQIDTADRLLKLVAIATRAAVIILQLVQARDGQSFLPAPLIFDSSEIAVLDAINASTYAGKTPLQRNPHPSRSLAWAAWLVGRLGGWDGYPSSRPPGPITFKNGLDTLRTLALGWALRNVCMP